MSRSTYVNTDPVNIEQANHPSPPTFFTADFNSITCFGDVIFSWTPGTSDRAIERYILYENGDQIATTSHTNSYSFSNTLENNRDYTYSIKAETCAGRSSATSSNVISIRGDPPSPPTSFTATFNSFNCSGDLELSWTPGASDRAIEMYILYDNGVEFKFINSTDSYSFSKTLENNRHYTYSIKAESCFGRSSALSSNVISVGDPPSPPTSFTATFNSLTCSGTVVLSWTPGASDRTIEMYFLYENGIEIEDMNPTDPYSLTKTLVNDMHYTYSIKAESCVGNSTKTYSNVISIGDPPSPATNFIASLPSVDPNSCYGAIYLSWIPRDSDRIIDMYVLALNGAEFVSVTTNYHFYAERFQLGLDYTYSLIAMSCAGNSTVTVSNVITIEGYVLDSIPTILSYNQSNSLLTIDWSILPDTSTTHPLLIDYSIDLFYYYTQSGDFQNHSDSVLFSLLSQDTNYTHTITPHSYENDYGVETAIRVCIQIIQQCNQAFSGMTQCGEYSIVNPTLQLSTSPIFAEGLLPVVIGSVGFIGLLSIILIVLLLSIFITVYCRFVKKRKDKTPDTDITPYLTFHNSSLHETETTTSPPTELEHTEYPSYTPMAALSHKQLQLEPSAYANLSD